MSNYNNKNIILQSSTNDGCLDQYYCYLVGMTTTTTTNHSASSIHPQQQQQQFVDINQYQKLYVDTLVGKAR